MTFRHLSLLALLAITAGCTAEAAQPVKAPAEPADPVVIALAIAKSIQAAPAKSDSILTAWSHTADSFEKLLADIAKDSGQSARYAAGMR
jgi:hypothetical protein